MDQYRKIILYIGTILFANCLHIHGQNISAPLIDSVFCYLTIDKKIREHNGYNLYIYNNSRDSVIIEDFNKYIGHATTFNFRQQEKVSFFWNLLTVSNQEIEDIVTIFPNAPTIKASEKQMAEKNKTIFIPPNSLFVSDVYMLSSPFVAYPKGYYKLCLYYEKNSKCIAEIIIKSE